MAELLSFHGRITELRLGCLRGQQPPAMGVCCCGDWRVFFDLPTVGPSRPQRRQILPALSRHVEGDHAAALHQSIRVITQTAKTIPGFGWVCSFAFRTRGLIDRPGVRELKLCGAVSSSSNHLGREADCVESLLLERERED